MKTPFLQLPRVALAKDLKFALAYAEQNEPDRAALAVAVKAGRIHAAPGTS